MTLPTQEIDFEDVSEDLGAIGVMGQNGDTKHLWNPKKPVEVEEARKLYETLTKNGYRAFRLKLGSMKGEQMTSFDEKAKRMVFVPAFAGG